MHGGGPWDPGTSGGAAADRARQGGGSTEHGKGGGGEGGLDQARQEGSCLCSCKPGAPGSVLASMQLPARVLHRHPAHRPPPTHKHVQSKCTVLINPSAAPLSLLGCNPSPSCAADAWLPPARRHVRRARQQRSLARPLQPVPDAPVPRLAARLGAAVRCLPWHPQHRPPGPGRKDQRHVALRVCGLPRERRGQRQRRLLLRRHVGLRRQRGVRLGA